MAVVSSYVKISFCFNSNENCFVLTFGMHFIDADLFAMHIQLEQMCCGLDCLWWLFHLKRWLHESLCHYAMQLVLVKRWLSAGYIRRIHTMLSMTSSCSTFEPNVSNIGQFAYERGFGCAQYARIWGESGDVSDKSCHFEGLNCKPSCIPAFVSLVWYHPLGKTKLDYWCFGIVFRNHMNVKYDCITSPNEYCTGMFFRYGIVVRCFIFIFFMSKRYGWSCFSVQVRNFERSFFKMWNLNCSGAHPRAFKVVEDDLQFPHNQ